MAEVRSIIVFHDCHFVRHLGIFNPIWVKLFQVMSGVIPCNLKKNDDSVSNRFPDVQKRGRHTQTDRQTDIHTHTLDDSIRRNAMRYISPKNVGSYVWGIYPMALHQEESFVRLPFFTIIVLDLGHK